MPRPGVLYWLTYTTVHRPRRPATAQLLRLMADDEHVWLSAVEQQREMEAGRLTSRGLALDYINRIKQLDWGGPRLKSVLEVNPEALEIASALDNERQHTGARSPLHGVCVLLKDNIDTADSMHTTTGSLALLDSVPVDDAHIVTRLRDLGAVILGKANLSEWANFRGESSSGWSARGGQCLNPHVLSITPSGSSSGSGVSVAAALTALAVGSETDGSIVSPANVNGIVGLKPTVGLVSRTGIIPISSKQDTAGPMGRTVADVALLLTALAGKDERDTATIAQPADILRGNSCYSDALLPEQQSWQGSLTGYRIGVLSSHFTRPLRAHPIGVGQEPQDLLSDEEGTATLLRAHCLTPLRECGAALVEESIDRDARGGTAKGAVIQELWSHSEIETLTGWGRSSSNSSGEQGAEGATEGSAGGDSARSELQTYYRKAMGYEFCQEVAKYLQQRRERAPALLAECGSGAGFMPQSVRDLADFNVAHKQEELALFGQESWLFAIKEFESTPAAEHERVSGLLKQLAGAHGIDKMLRAGGHKCDCLVCPTASSSFPASICGYPVLSVPAGVVRGLPFGLAFIGTAWSEPTLLRIASAFERRTRAFVRPRFRVMLDPLPPLQERPRASL